MSFNRTCVPTASNGEPEGSVRVNFLEDADKPTVLICEKGLLPKDTAMPWLWGDPNVVFTAVEERVTFSEIPPSV